TESAVSAHGICLTRSALRSPRGRARAHDRHRRSLTGSTGLELVRRRTSFARERRVVLTHSRRQRSLLPDFGACPLAVLASAPQLVRKPRILHPDSKGIIAAWILSSSGARLGWKTHSTLHFIRFCGAPMRRAGSAIAMNSRSRSTGWYR